MASVATRAGEAARSAVVLAVDLVTIVTQIILIVATQLDATADAIKDGLEKKK